MASKKSPFDQPLGDLLQLIAQSTVKVSNVVKQQNAALDHFEKATSSYASRLDSSGARAGVGSYQELLKRPMSRKDLQLPKIVQLDVAETRVRVHAHAVREPLDFSRLQRPRPPQVLRKRPTNVQPGWGVHPLEQQKRQAPITKPKEAALTISEDDFIINLSSGYPNVPKGVTEKAPANSAALQPTEGVRRPPPPPKRGSSEILIEEGAVPRKPPPPRRSSLEMAEAGIIEKTRSDAEKMAAEAPLEGNSLATPPTDATSKSAAPRKPPPPRRASMEVPGTSSSEHEARRGATEGDAASAGAKPPSQAPPKKPPPPPKRNSSEDVIGSARPPKETPLVKPPPPPTKRTLSAENSDEKASTATSESQVSESEKPRAVSGGSLAARQAMLAGMLSGGSVSRSSHPVDGAGSGDSSAPSNAAVGARNVATTEEPKKPKSLADDAGLATAANELQKKLGAALGKVDLSKYKKMQKAGLPLGAIEHAMRKDGVDPKQLDFT